MKKVVMSLVLILFLATSVNAISVSEIWNASYNTGALDLSYGIVSDSAGNIFITGTNNNYHTIKYNSTGDVQWSVTDSKAVGRAYGIAIDSDENIYITGYAEIPTVEIYTIKYNNSNGVQLMNLTYTGTGSNYGQAIAVDSSGNIFITGYDYIGSNNDFFTIKYNRTGHVQWTTTYDSTGTDLAYAIALDSEENVYITGQASNNYYTIKYNSSNNATMWAKQYDGLGVDSGNAITVDSAMNTYVTGSSVLGANADYYTIKYNSTGDKQWAKIFDAGGSDIAYGITKDSLNNIYVTGGSTNTNSDFHTIKYNSTGDEQWNITSDVSSADNGRGIVLDSSNNIFITGYQNLAANYRYHTIKYSVNAIYSAPTSGFTATLTATGSSDGVLNGGNTYSTKQNITFTDGGGQKYFETEANFNSNDVNLSKIIIAVSTGKIVVNSTGATGLGTSHTLYLPNNNNNGVYVCPNANAISEVVSGCVNEILFSQSECSSITTTNGVTCSISGSDFKLAGLTGSGAGEGSSATVPEFGDWALIIAILGAFVGITIIRKDYSF